MIVASLIVPQHDEPPFRHIKPRPHIDSNDLLCDIPFLVDGTRLLHL